MALTVRMSPETERALNRLAKRRKLSRSDVVREAIARYEESQSEQTDTGAYDAWVDVIGVVELSVRETAATTGDQFAALIKKDRRPRAR